MPRSNSSRLHILVGYCVLLCMAACSRPLVPPAVTASPALFPTLTPGPVTDPFVPTLTVDVVNAPSPTPPILSSLAPAMPAATAFVPPDIEVPSALEPVPCESFEVLSRASPLQGYTLCGYVTVPESHSDSGNGRTLQLAVVIYKSPNREASPDPLLLAQGGPGGSTLYLFGNSASFLLPQVLQRRDMLLIEQRGTRFSRPFLYCDEVEYFLMESLASPAGYEDVSEKQEAVRRCHERLTREGINLSAYNSVENAHDMAYVAQALGYPEFNFYGVSYGALLGQHLLRYHPERLRSVVLDSVVPMQTNWITEAPRSASNALSATFAACASDAQCSREYPSLEETFLDTVNRLNRDPVELVVENQESHLNVRLTGDLFIRVLYDMMYIEAASIPRIVATVAEGNSALIRTRILDHAVWALAGTNGMYASTMCAEDADYEPDQLVRLDGLYPEVARVVGGTLDNDLLELCPAWPVPPLPAEVDTPVQSDVPTLLLSGALDPITPPAFAEEVASGLPNRTVLIFPTQSHGVLFRTECARTIVARFILDPQAHIDATCVARSGSIFR